MFLPAEGYSRNASCAINYISMFVVDKIKD